MIYYLVLAKSYPHHLKTDYIRIYHNLYMELINMILFVKVTGYTVF